MPFALDKPGKDRMAPHVLAALVEGRFDSAFDKAPAADPGANASASTSLTADTHLHKSTQSGKLFVAGTSEIAGPALIDQQGRQPVALFVRNALDYLAGNPELNDMRTKGLDPAPLDKTTPSVRLAAKSLNMYGLPLIVALVGLFAWRRRSKPSTHKSARIRRRTKP
jgi:ABC-type uncharacterized transport system involved in gliding motility auxiliary subunit